MSWAYLNETYSRRFFKFFPNWQFWSIFWFGSINLPVQSGAQKLTKVHLSLTNEPSFSNRCLSSSLFTLRDGRLSIEARNSFEGPVTKRRQFVSENAFLSRVLMLLHQSLGIVSCDPCDPTKIYWRIMDLDQWFLAVSLQTNDRIHSRVELFWGKRKTADPSMVSLFF